MKVAKGHALRKPGRGHGVKRPKPKPGKKKHPSIKNRIRGIQRLLQKDGLDPKVKAKKQQELEELTQEAEKQRQQEKERKFAVRYHKVRFFERVKLERQLLKLQRKQQQGSSLTAEEQHKLQQVQEDLQYVLHFPKGEKYVSILKDVQDEEAQKKLVAERERLRQLVKKQLAQLAAVTEADEGLSLANKQASKGPAPRAAALKQGTTAPVQDSRADSDADDFFLNDDDDDDDDGNDDDDDDDDLDDDEALAKPVQRPQRRSHTLPARDQPASSPALHQAPSLAAAQQASLKRAPLQAAQGCPVEPSFEQPRKKQRQDQSHTSMPNGHGTSDGINASDDEHDVTDGDFFRSGSDVESEDDVPASASAGSAHHSQARHAKHMQLSSDDQDDVMGGDPSGRPSTAGVVHKARAGPPHNKPCHQTAGQQQQAKPWNSKHRSSLAQQGKGSNTPPPAARSHNGHTGAQPMHSKAATNRHVGPGSHSSQRSPGHKHAKQKHPFKAAGAAAHGKPSQQASDRPGKGFKRPLASKPFKAQGQGKASPAGKAAASQPQRTRAEGGRKRRPKKK